MVKCFLQDILAISTYDMIMKLLCYYMNTFSMILYFDLYLILAILRMNYLEIRT